MRRLPRCEYTLEFKLEAVQRAAEQGIYAASRELGLAEQTLRNWVKAQQAGGLLQARQAKPVTTQQMEASRQRAAEARLRRRAQWRSSPLHTGTAATMPA
ncbi:transposase [Pelomonas sp. V22]|nr:transposase [Pelomonas sp. V22]